MSEREHPLAGGNLNTGVVRVGDTVRRQAGEWTPSVHALLRYLASVSYPAPHPLGIDEEGREVLSFIPGDPAHPNHLDVLESEAAMRRAGRLIAGYHRAQAGFVPPQDAIWRSEGRDPTGSDEVLAHNDLAPWNLIVGPGDWVFIDWDLVAPGRRLWDLAWAVHSFAGLWPGSATSDDQVIRRIAAFCDGAEVEPTDRPHLLDIVVERTREHADMLRDKSDAGDAAFVRLVENGHAEAWESGSRHVEANRDRWAAGLRE